MIVFHHKDDQATRSVAQVVEDAVAVRPESFASVAVQISNPAEQAIVKQFDVCRDPMPLTMVSAL